MIKLTLLFTLIILAGIFCGRLLTESNRFALSNISSKLNRKPFNCRPCLTFHLIWIMFSISAALLHSIIFFATGLVAALLVFGILYFRDKQKIIK